MGKCSLLAREDLAGRSTILMLPNTNSIFYDTKLGILLHWAEQLDLSELLAMLKRTKSGVSRA